MPSTNRGTRLYDTTLRDGEQAARLSFGFEQRLSIAKLVSDLGCHVLDVGFPASNPLDAATTTEILRARRDGELRRDVEILVMSRCAQRDIDLTVEALRASGFSPGDVSLLLFTSASELHLRNKVFRHVDGVSGGRVPADALHRMNIDMVRAATRHATDRGFELIEFGAEDASRTPTGVLLPLVAAALDAGASRYIFADTVGTLTPETTATYCKALAARFPDTELVSHFHNDYGLAVANALAAWQCGMRTVSVTLNGIGERCGNVPTHTFVTALAQLKGEQIDGFRYQRLTAASNAMERLTGVPLSPFEPVVGRNAFAHESGVHVQGVSATPETYESVSPETVGNTHAIYFGRHSGRAGVEETLRRHASELGFPVDEALVTNVLKQLKMSEPGRRELAVRAAFIDGIDERYRAMGLSTAGLVALAREIGGATRHPSDATSAAS